MPSSGTFIRDLRDWARAVPIAGGRVYMRIPETVPVYPVVRLFRSGGSRQPGDTPIYNVNVAWDVWGGAEADFDAVETATAALVDAIDYMGADDLSTTRILNADAQNVIISPDPETGWPRNIIDSQFTYVLL